MKNVELMFSDRWRSRQVREELEVANHERMKT